MLDLFGSKRRSILSSKQFQENLVHVRDFRNLILKMSDSDTPPKIIIELDNNFANGIVSYIRIALTTHVYNPHLCFLLNSYYEDFGLKKFFEAQYNAEYNRSLPNNMTYLTDTSEQLTRRVETAMETAREAEDIARHDALDKISHALFRDEASFSLYESYKKLHGTDITDLLYDGFGIPKRYVPSGDDCAYTPFSDGLSLKTGLPDEYRGGSLKPSATIQDERNFYAKILLDELNKI
mgnify:CR=1 FL=1